MKVGSLLAAAAAFVRTCSAIEEVEAARVIYFYTVYDLDVEVWGQGNGYIAPECKGVVIPDGRCTFDEFVNFVDTGEASTNPKYHDLTNSFSFLPGDINAMVLALDALDAKIEDVTDKVVRGRRSAVGIWDDLATIVDKDHARAEARNINTRRHFTNLKEALTGVTAHTSAHLEMGTLDRMRSYRKDVIWKIVNRESEYRKAGWQKIDWQATIAANPDLAYADSNLYQNTAKALKGFDTLRGTMAEKSIAYKTANTFNACFSK
ncbi:uncharacterized protein J7T54_007856 [Emericellopsis cladophorae]|uniref:Uncharacterized protein n=1 Tax=Emericellopsis cladophorae TaxID=2686198 RepID=A0A9P9Y7Y7_9HYPO|nr:uncharacterized protein J7T54_007856 [Emericellopsis cladophorae]KAI6784763.1 hypothetical protein J7T54_007856 [Emericellopsis cladophorae]